MTKMIAMPWTISGVSNAFVRMRYDDKNRSCGWVSYSSYLYLWSYHAYDLDGVSIFEISQFPCSAISQIDAMNAVDKALIKAGWRLLNDEDVLMVLV